MNAERVKKKYAIVSTLTVRISQSGATALLFRFAGFSVASVRVCRCVILRGTWTGVWPCLLRAPSRVNI